MFDSIRKHQRWLLVFVIILILPAFVFFGISGYDRMFAGEQGVASVNGEPITEQEFGQAYGRRLDSLRQMLGDAVDVSLFDTPAARQEVLESLVSRRVIELQARESRIAVTDDQLREAILAIPGLRRDDGIFDDERYRVLLSAQNMTPAGFEAMVRSDLVIQALPESVTGSVFSSASLRDRLIALQLERRQVREWRFDAQARQAGLKADEARLRAFHQEQAALFESPETTRFEYVVLERAALAGQVQVSAEAVRAFYDQNASRFGTPEERRASHILVKAGADAGARVERLLQDLKQNPKRFADLAREHSVDPGSAGQGGDLGFFDRNSMVKPFADAVFEMQPGDIRGPIQTEFGLHIIQLTGVRPGSVKPFAEVRAQVEAELKLQQATQQFAQAAETFTNMVYEQPDSLQPVAERFKLTVQTAGVRGRRPDPSALPGSAQASARLIAALFTEDVLRNKRNTEAIEVAPGVLASARVIEHLPARQQPFEAVAQAVEERWRMVEGAKLAREAGEARLKLLAGKGPEAGGLSGFGEPFTVTRGDPGPLSAEALVSVFKLPASGLPQPVGVDLGLRGYAIYELVRVLPPDENMLAQQREAIERQIVQILAQQDVDAYVQSLRSRAKVITRPERLQTR